MEIRVHGRGGQGGVTAAKILAAIHARLGKTVQTFGDYAGERSGAPVRAYTRVNDGPVTNRNKVYDPDELLILDPTLLGADVVAGLKAGGTLLINSPHSPESFQAAFPGYRLATIDATAIARRHRIGTRSVVIVNTTIAGAYARICDISFAVVEAVYQELGLGGNLGAGREAYDNVSVIDDRADRGSPARPAAENASAWGKTQAGPVPDLVHHLEGSAPTLKTGAWRSQTPAYVQQQAPCSVACPADNDVIGFIQTLHRRGEDAAAEVLARTSPLSGVCGRVCEGFCLKGCNRQDYDGAVDTRGIERWIADHSRRVPPVRAVPSHVRRIAIVGAGPAGLSAAYHLARAGHSVSIYEREPALGGVLRTGIPTYRLPREALDREIQAILGLGLTVHLGQTLAGERLRSLVDQYDGVVVATGLQRLHSLDGADRPGVEQGIQFLHRINMARDMRERGELNGQVMVLGGGNTAMDCARSAVRLGASRVTVAYRRTRAQMPAIADEITEAQSEGVEFLFLRAPTGFLGTDALQAVELAEMELGAPDVSGRQSSQPTGRSERVAVDHALLALGQSVDLSLLPEGWQVSGSQLIDGDGRALNAFLCGDLATNLGTVPHAISDGRKVATAMLAALGAEPSIHQPPTKTKPLDPSAIRFDHFAKIARANAEHRQRNGPLRDFKETCLGLPSGAEALRCFSCGTCTECDTCLVFCPDGVIRRLDQPAGGKAYSVDHDYCKGCGLCAAECPRGAIVMQADG
jgi:2-oxoacid:acceptor oxidoreductase gamma subunit (pyruvate/2-ketoisovalerate family)